MKDALGIIFAFDDSNELKELVARRTVSAIPFGGRYRIIDFMLSNMTNAGICEVGVILKNKYQSLMDHVGSGKDWDLARKNGGVSLLPPYSYSKKDVVGSGGPYRGDIEGLAGVFHFLQRSKTEYVVLSNGDIVSNINLRKVFDEHVANDADITAVCVPRGNNGSTFLSCDEEGLVNDVLISDFMSPDVNITYSKEAAGIYVIKKDLLEKLVLECSAKNLYHFNRDILQRLCGKLKIKTYMHDGYFSRITDPVTFFRSNMDLLNQDNRNNLFNSKFPINTRSQDNAPARYSSNANVKNSLISDGCIIDGTVINSIIFRGAKIKAGAVVENCIIMQDSVVDENSNLSYVVADKNVYIGSSRNISGHDSYPVFISKGSTI